MALALARKGCHIAAVDIAPGGLDQTANLVRELGRRASVHQVDVADAAQTERLPDEVGRELGACQLLINNAGVTSAGAFEKESLDDIAWIVGTNMWGVVHGCHAFLPMLRAQPKAYIVNVSSMVALIGLPHNAVYGMTTGAVRSFSEALRAELVTSNIALTTVYPGAYQTGITATARWDLRDLLATLGRSGLARFVMSPPDSLARRVVKAIERGRARVVAGRGAHFLDLWGRMAPGRVGTLGRLTGFADGKYHQRRSGA